MAKPIDYSGTTTSRLSRSTQKLPKIEALTMETSYIGVQEWEDTPIVQPLTQNYSKFKKVDAVFVDITLRHGMCGKLTI